MKKEPTLEDVAYAALRRAHRNFVKAAGGQENDFTNGYTWGFVEGFKKATRRKERPASTVTVKHE